MDASASAFYVSHLPLTHRGLGEVSVDDRCRGLATAMPICSLQGHAGARFSMDSFMRFVGTASPRRTPSTFVCYRGCNASRRQRAVMAGHEQPMRLQVMESSGNPWRSVSAGAWMTLRQPMCMVLLRSSAMEDAAAFQLAPRLFACILCRTPLRFSLKAELGAFFPLLLHKPLEMEAAHGAVVVSALEASARIAGEPQLMVDLFVNYDCDLHAVNIFERWMHGLQRVAVGGDDASADGEHCVGERAAAIACVALVLRSLAGWVQALEGAAEPRVQEAPDGQADTAETLRRSEAEIEVREQIRDTTHATAGTFLHAAYNVPCACGCCRRCPLVCVSHICLFVMV